MEEKIHNNIISFFTSLIKYVCEYNLSQNLRFLFNFYTSIKKKKSGLCIRWIASDVANISWKWKTVITAAVLAHFQLSLLVCCFGVFLYCSNLQVVTALSSRLTSLVKHRKSVKCFLSNQSTSSTY